MQYHHGIIYKINIVNTVEIFQFIRSVLIYVLFTSLHKIIRLIPKAYMYEYTFVTIATEKLMLNYLFEIFNSS